MVARSNSLPLLNRHLFAFARVFVCLPGACFFVAFDIDQGGNRRIDTRGFQTPPPCSVLLETALEFSLLLSAMRQFEENRLLCTRSHQKLNASLQDELGGKSSPLFFFSCRGKNGASVMTFNDKEHMIRTNMQIKFYKSHLPSLTHHASDLFFKNVSTHCKTTVKTEMIFFVLFLFPLSNNG